MKDGGWKYKLGRVYAEQATRCGQVIGERPCGEAAPYRVQAWQGQRDPVHEKMLCTQHAAKLALRVGLKFPPGMWEA